MGNKTSSLNEIAYYVAYTLSTDYIIFFRYNKDEDFENISLYRPQFDLDSNELKIANLLIDEVTDYIEDNIDYNRTQSTIFGICGDSVYISGKHIKFEIFKEEYAHNLPHNITWLKLSNLSKVE